MSIGLWQCLPYKDPRGLIHHPHGHWEKKEFNLKGNWGGLLCHQTLPDNSPPTKITEDAICPHDRIRISHRKPGWVRTCSQSPDYSFLSKSAKRGDQQSLIPRAPGPLHLCSADPGFHGCWDTAFTWKASQKEELPPNTIQPFCSQIHSLPPRV